MECRDALFAIERTINGAMPHERSRPLVRALETWLREALAARRRSSVMQQT